MINWQAPSRVLIVEDSQEQVRLLERLLQLERYECAAVFDGDDAFDAAVAFAPDVVLLDVNLPHLDGLSICRRLKATPDTSLIPVLIITGQGDIKHQIDAFEAGADDFLPKPTSIAALRARVRSAVKLKKSIDSLDDAAASILMLGSTIEARDQSTSGHCERLRDYSVRLGERIGLSDEDRRALEQGGYLHDLGKISIPDAVLFKTGRLTAAEFNIIKTHPAVGDRLCAPLRSLQRVRPIVRSHHETLDGTGYPDGLRGSSVPLLAQIVAIADVYDALTTDRPYRAKQPCDVAFDMLRAEASTGKRDRALVDQFIDMMSRLPSAPPLREGSHSCDDSCRGGRAGRDVACISDRALLTHCRSAS